MDYETNLIVENGIEVPESVLLKRDRGNRYGSVFGLDENELADPDELERQVFQQEFGPVLSLPIKQNRNSLRPELDESGNIDLGAFGTIDFERYSNTFNKARYKADKLNEHLKDIKIMISIINDRLETRAKYLVLKYYERGIIELNHIVNTDMQALARRYIQAKKLLQEIKHLRQTNPR